MKLVNQDNRIIIASRERLQTRMNELKKDGEMTKTVDRTVNQPFITFYAYLTKSDDSILAMGVSNEQTKFCIILNRLQSLTKTLLRTLY